VGRPPYRAPSTPVQARIAELWSRRLGLDRIGLDDNIFDLGADSLTTARIYAEIATTFGVRLPLAPAFAAPTVERTAALVDASRNRVGPDSAFTALAPLRATGTKRPLFLVHGGAGTILFYEPLVRRLGPEQPVYGLQAVGLYGQHCPQQSVEDMAKRYVSELRMIQPEGPYRLGGYCFGALVAYEMAVQLADAGQRTDLLVSFNGPSPAYLREYRPFFDGDGAVRQPVSPTVPVAPDRRAVPVSEQLRRRAVAWYFRGRRRTRITIRSARFAWYLRRGSPLPESLREASGFQRLAAIAQKNYHPRPYQGDMVVVQGSGLYERTGLLWDRHATGDVIPIKVIGEHVTPRSSMAEPLIADTARQLSGLLDNVVPTAVPD
jgi:acyl carrier protein